MNMKRLILACVFVFVFLFLFEWGLHGGVLRNAYKESAQLWRSDADMGRHFGLIIRGQVVLSVMFCLIYALRRGTDAGPAQGAGYGLLVGILLATGPLIAFATQPLPSRIVGAWIVGAIIEFVIAGAILGAIYRPRSTPTVGSAQPAPA